MRWLFLISAAICEMLWFYCIAYLKKFTWQELTSLNLLHAQHGWWVLGAVIGYAGFGVANMIFFTKSVKRIPASVAFSVWTGLALVGITLCDGLFREVQLYLPQIGCIILILVGVMGLKFYSKQ